MGERRRVERRRGRFNVRNRNKSTNLDAVCRHRCRPDGWRMWLVGSTGQYQARATRRLCPRCRGCGQQDTFCPGRGTHRQACRTEQRLKLKLKWGVMQAMRGWYRSFCRLHGPVPYREDRPCIIRARHTRLGEVRGGQTGEAEGEGGQAGLTRERLVGASSGIQTSCRWCRFHARRRSISSRSAPRRGPGS